MAKHMKMTKKAFEAMLVDKYGHENLIGSPYDENQYDVPMDDGVKPTYIRFWLYYLKGKGEEYEEMDGPDPVTKRDDAHIATWSKGEGWFVGTTCGYCEGTGTAPAEDEEDVIECPDCHGATVVD